MDYKFSLADRSDLEGVYTLIDQRIGWMDKMGIRQWNVTDYWTVYPKEHYVEQLQQGRLYVMKRLSDESVAAAAVLYDADARWPDGETACACYIHHFAADLKEKGVGSILLLRLEQLALRRGKAFMRLDCPSDSPRLNQYYEQRGYVPAGTCLDGKYSGNLKEKALK